MTCTRSSRTGEPARSPAQRSVSIALSADYPWLPASAGPRSGDQFAAACGVALTRRAARKLPLATVGSWPRVPVRGLCRQLTFGHRVRALKGSFLARTAIHVAGHQLTVATGRFLASRLVDLARWARRRAVARQENVRLRACAAASLQVGAYRCVPGCGASFGWLHRSERCARAAALWRRVHGSVCR